jgi:5'-nucleotidase
LLGNHEFDEGVDELRRLVRGGNHPKGPFLGAVYRGEEYPTICSNVVDARTGRTLLPPYVVKELGGIRVGFVGAVYDGAPWFITQSGISSVRFENEVTRINANVAALKRRGIRAIVVLIHQGGRQRFSRDLPRDASAVSGEVAETIRQLDAEVDLVVSGHSHTALSALVPNGGGKSTLLTQAFDSGTAFADIELDIDSNDGQVVAKRASIVSTFADTGPGLELDRATLSIVQTAERAAEQQTSRVIGRAKTSFSRAANEHGESTLGDLIADAQRAALQGDFAFSSPVSVRASLDAGTVTWGDLFEVQPFGSPLARVELFGKQVIELLNQQWAVESYARILHVSGLTYTWDARRAPNDRVVDVTVQGRPIQLDKKYVAVANEFLAEGGEGFSALAHAPRRTSELLDIDALVAAFRRDIELVPRADGRIRRIDLAAGMP